MTRKILEQDKEQYINSTGDTIAFSAGYYPSSFIRFKGIVGSVSIRRTGKIDAVKGLVLYKRYGLPYVAFEEVITNIVSCRMVLTEKVIKPVEDEDYIKSILVTAAMGSIMEELNNL